MNDPEEVDEEMTEEVQKRFEQGGVLGKTDSGIWKYGLIMSNDKIKWCPIQIAPVCIEKYMRSIIKMGG